MKPSVMVAKLAASDALMTTRMQANGLSRAADWSEILVDKQPSIKTIEIGLIGANEIGDLVDPRGMIDQLLPRFSALIDLLKVQPLMSAGEIMSMDPPAPLAGPAILKRIEAFVARRNLLRWQRTPKNKVSVQIEQITFHICQTRPLINCFILSEYGLLISICFIFPNR